MRTVSIDGWFVEAQEMASTFAELLRDHRLKSGLSQEGLAERIGVNRAYIAMLETGRRRNPSRQKLAAIMNALGLSDSESQQIAAALGDRMAPNPPSVVPSSPVLAALADLLALPANSPLVREKIGELYKRLSAVLSERGATPQQKKETRWLQLVTKGYMYTAPEGRQAGGQKAGAKQKRRLSRSQEDEFRMGDRLRSLLEIFVDGRIHISKRAALAEDLLKYARWQVVEQAEPSRTQSRRRRSKEKREDGDDSE
jgi:transcriptional regulator with XRE-family HTH domain